MAKNFPDGSLKNIKDELSGFLDDFFKSLPKNPEDADDATVKRFVRDALRGSLGTTSETKPLARRPEKSNLKPWQAMTIGGRIIDCRQEISTKRNPSPLPPKIKKKSLIIPSSLSSSDEIVDFLAERVSDTEETAIRSSLSSFSIGKLEEIADDATDRPNASHAMRLVMRIVQGVRLRRKSASSDSSSTESSANPTNPQGTSIILVTKY